MHLLPVTSRRDNGRIRVLEVIGNANVGGMENYISNFLANLPEDQFQVTCICPYESPFTNTLRKLGVDEVYVTPIEDDPLWRSIQLAVEVMRLHQIDIVHAHMPKAHVLAGLAGCLEYKPVVATIHGMHITAHEFGVSRSVNSHLITNCQEAYSQALAMGVPANRLSIVRNSVDISVFTPEQSGDKLRNEINLPHGTSLVGFVGRLEHEKGPDMFLRAAEYVHNLRPDVHFVLVGEGTMRKELGKMALRFGLNKHVHFVEWCANTNYIYPALDLLAHTSRSDGTSLVLLEAMSCGCPTVALAVGGVREIMENRSTGLLTGPGDWEGIGTRIIELLEHPERLKTMGIAARARVEKHFNVKTNTLKTADILRSITFAGLNSRQFTANGTLARKKTGKVSLGNSEGEAG